MLDNSLLKPRSRYLDSSALSEQISEYILVDIVVEFRHFFEFTENKHRTLLVMEFQYDDETDWYECRVFRGAEIIGYMHGYGNRGWSPQVNNIWVADRFRRRGIGAGMMAKVESYFGQIPVPGTLIEDNEAARGFWEYYTSGRFTAENRKSGDDRF